MNKKFFTLIASAFMLVASVGTINAQDSFGSAVTNGITPAQQANNLYHLIGTTGDQSFAGALTISDNGRLYLQDTLSYTGTLGHSLWCISVEDPEDQGRTPTFQFTNRGSNHQLRVTETDLNLAPTDSIDVQFGTLSRWNFSLVYDGRLETLKPFILYYTTDRVLALVRTSAGEVGVESFPGDHDFSMASNPDVIYFSVYSPAEVVLNAQQFNSIISTTTPGYRTLTFVPAPSDVSEFQTPIRATDVPFSAFGPGVGATDRWLLFERNVSGLSADEQVNKYLRVDTAYTGEYGVRFLKFAWGDAPVTTGDVRKVAIHRQYYFQARYNVMNDSLAIDVMQATFPKEGYTGHWYDYPHKTQWGVTASVGAYDGRDSLHVKLQDLVAGERSILTIGTREVSTRIELGLEGCGNVPITFTSVANNLYTIQNAKGEYLIVRINTDTTTNITAEQRYPIWIDLKNSNQDPNRIPSFQWVVEQTRPDFPTTSPIRITNREFGVVVDGKVIPTQTLQLTTTGSNIQLFGQTVYANNFIAVPDAQKADKYLGYKYLPDDSLKFNTYDFNYLNKQFTDKYLYIGGTDSSVILNQTDGQRTQFELISQSAPRRYGYWTANVPNLARLERVSYVIRVKDGNAARNNGAVLFADKQTRYAVTKNRVDTAIFLLKTNNTKDGRDYYALLDTGSHGRRLTVLDRSALRNIKLGIDDANAWATAQEFPELRTSTFYIAPYNEPLYRRFDGATYGKYKIKEPYGNSTNAPVWLKFSSHNNWGTEFLFENSPRGAGSKNPQKPNENDYRDGLSANGKSTISFLGMYNRADYPENNPHSNYTFYVDTAYVRHNTPMPQYMLAVRPEFVKGDTIWTVRKDSTWNSQGQSWSVTYDTTMTVRPSFTRAFYVYNAQDSIGADDADNYNPRNADYIGKIQYGAENSTRLAFVDGIHMGDTFYVLRDKPLTTEIDSAYLLRIPASHKVYLGRNTHYTPRYGRNGLPIWGNNPADYHSDAHNGKSMVFQFRLYDPTGAGDANETAEMVRKFYIESRKDPNEQEIGPAVGRWIRIQNMVPIISKNVALQDASQNDAAHVFNVLQGEENNAVSNEKNPEASSVQVTGEYGGVNILNAAGANVTVTNILGQTVASKYINSDNETISVPKGIVVVAVDGEAFKAVVK